MSAIRKVLLLLNALALSAMTLWAYASHRNDNLNVGGVKGDVNFWIRMSEFGCYFGLVLWLCSVLLALHAALSGQLGGRTEKALWILASLLGSPLVFFSLISFFD